MPYVLDASVALAWLLPDEASKDADALAARLSDFEALEKLRRLAFAQQVDEPKQLELWKEEAAE